MNKVTVIIPNYNGLQFMEPCLKALEGQNYKEFDLLVVDNGSQDGSGEWLRERGIPTLFLGENTGFSGAVNAGIRAVSTPYVILLNNDTEPLPDYVGELVRCMDRFPEVFSASSKMIQLYHKDLMDDAGDMYSVLGWAYQRGVGQPSSGYQRACQVFAACAGAAIYRRATLPIWRTLTWATGRGSTATGTCTAPRRRSTTWAAAPAVPSTIPLRSAWPPATICI